MAWCIRSRRSISLLQNRRCCRHRLVGRLRFLWLWLCCRLRSRLRRSAYSLPGMLMLWTQDRILHGIVLDTRRRSPALSRLLDRHPQGLRRHFLLRCCHHHLRSLYPHSHQDQVGRRLGVQCIRTVQHNRRCRILNRNFFGIRHHKLAQVGRLVLQVLR